MKCKLALSLSFAALLAAALCSAQAFGQAVSDYPSKAIRIIVPVAPGGNVDIVARTVAAELAKSMGQPVIVENRPSAASIVGTQLVAKAAPDGYTLLAHSSTFFTAPTISANAGYDPVRDFAPITLTCKAPMFMEVHPSVPARTVAEFVALAKAKPGEMTNANSGNGSTGHMAGEVFASRAGVKLLNVFYKGSAQAVIDVIGGQAMLMFDQISTSGPHVKGGKLRALAVTSLQRSKSAPDIPTISEAGAPGYEATGWFGVLVPTGTPADIIAKMNAELGAILKQPDVEERFLKFGAEGGGGTPEQFAAFIRAEQEKWGKVIREARIRID